MLDPKALDRLEPVLAGLLTRHRVPGAAIGIVEGDGATRVISAGLRGQGRGPVDEGSVFFAASLTKPVFASGVLALVDAGVLELDRPLSEYVAEPYLADDERAAWITARMVLSHTTGFPNWRRDGPLFLRWTPGTRWGYSGEGFSYLQRVVECLTGVDLPRYMADAVFGPLGMKDSSFVWPDEDDPRLAIGHGHDGEVLPPFRPPMTKAAAGAMFTTAADYLRFLVHALSSDHRVFEPQSRIDDQIAWALGWGLEDGPERKAIWQWGDDPGYKNFVIGVPADGVGAVVLTNGDNGVTIYTAVVRQLFPGPHPSLETLEHPSWITSWVESDDST